MYIDFVTNDRYFSFTYIICSFNFTTPDISTLAHLFYHIDINYLFSSTNQFCVADIVSIM